MLVLVLLIVLLLVIFVLLIVLLLVLVFVILIALVLVSFCFYHLLVVFHLFGISCCFHTTKFEQKPGDFLVLLIVLLLVFFCAPDCAFAGAFLCS